MDEKTIVVDEELQKEIASAIVGSEDFKKALSESNEEAAKKAAEMVLAKFDVADKKDLGGEDKGEEDEEVTGKGFVAKMLGGSADLAEKFAPLSTLTLRDLNGKEVKMAEMSKERRFYLGVRALIQKDSATIQKLNEFAGELFALKAFKDGRFSEMAQKAGYANDAVSADGGALVPDPEFNTEVYNNLPKWGTIFKYGNVRSTDRTAVYALSLTGSIAFTNVAEAGAISGTKLVFNRTQVNLLKYAAIIPATAELDEDSIIDYWQIVTNEIARQYGLVADQLVFTDTTYGIVHHSGVITQPLISGGAGTTIAWDDLLAAEGALEDALDTSDFKWHMRKETFFRLARTKTTGSGQYYQESLDEGWNPNPNNPTTPWGTPIVFTRVLPKTTEVGANGALAVYGTLQNTNFYNKNGMALTMLTEAAVTDANGNSFNLATQDGLAMRVVVRILHILPTGNAPKFAVVGTGTVS